MIMYLKKEAEHSDAKIVRMELNLEGVKRKKKYVSMDNRILRATEAMEQSGDIDKFVRNVSFFIQMD